MREYIVLQQLDLKILDPTASAEDDMRLLRLYAQEGDQGAFSTLVSRHMGWVYSACKRGLRDRHLAEDAAQAVFLTLSRRAKSISPKVRLSGWLFKTTRFAVADARKREMRHQRRQEVAAARETEKLTKNLNEAEAQLWEAVAPNMDDALAYLCERDRQAVVLHFFEGLSFSEMGPILNLSKEGAKKRVSRAIDKLKGIFARKGVKVAAPVLLAVLYANLVEAAPAGLVASTAAAASGAGPATYGALTIARGIIGLMNNTVTLLVKAMLAAEAAAIILIGVVAMNHGVGVGSPVAKKSAAPGASDSVVVVATSADGAAKLGGAKTAAKDRGMNEMVLRSPWAPVDERPYAGDLEAAASEVVAKVEEAAGAAGAVAPQLVTFDKSADESISGSLAGSPPGWRLAMQNWREEGGARVVAAKVLDVRTLPAGWAGWGEEFGPITSSGEKRVIKDQTPDDPLAIVIDPHLRTMINALLKGGDGDLIVLRKDDGRFHFYLPEALEGGALADLKSSFADFSGAELRQVLGYQNYRKLVHIAEKPDLQLAYNRAVPEPSSILVVGVGMMVLVRRRRRGV